MLRQLLELESCIVMWLNLDLLPCTVTGSWIDLDLYLTGSRVPGYINFQIKFLVENQNPRIERNSQKQSECSEFSAGCLVKYPIHSNSF